MQPSPHSATQNVPDRPSRTPVHQDELPLVRSRDLLQGGNLIQIEHDEARYYLRMTRNNKLILTK